MAIIYYAKVNVNLNIFKVYAGEMEISDILEKLFKKINDKREFIKTYTYFVETDKGLEEREGEEKYCFSNINKFRSPRKYITGSIIKRTPLFTEEYDDETRKAKKVVYENNAVGINFYFDVENELVAFCTRRNFKQIQFAEAFQELINVCMIEEGFEVFILHDTSDIRERLKGVHKITKIRAVFIPPNANEENLQSLYDKSIERMEKANITKKTNIFEISRKSKKGINLEADMVEEVLSNNDVLKNYESGYGKIEAEGEHRDGSKFHYDSEADSPYTTLIDDSVKNVEWEFVKASQNGINIYLAKNMKVH